MKNVTEYITGYRAIQKEIEKGASVPDKKIRIAVLASSTVQGLKETLFVTCYEMGVLPEIYVGDYNQYVQEIYDDHSGLYAFNPDLLILFVDAKSLFGDSWFGFYQLDGSERQNLTRQIIEQFHLMADTVKGRLNCKMVIHNLEVPVFSPLGIIDNKLEGGLAESIRLINDRLVRDYREDNRVFVFDYDLFCSRFGKEQALDYKMYYIGDFRLDMKLFPQLCDVYGAYIRPLLSMTKKCIVLDLDNTLWGGIVGEEGLEGIDLGPTPEGRPYMEFQHYLLSLFHRGVILAINSKNNPDDALKAIREHPYMVLKEHHFAAMKMNWDDKVTNMRAIAEELNIGPDSFVFFDDDPLNREMVRQELPEVHVVELPDDPALYLKTAAELPDFNSFHLSDEDKKKGQIYAEQRKRVELSKKTTDITSYLKALNMTVTIEKVNPFNIPRIAQLTQKTNQFNLTTKRYMDEEIEAFASSDDHLVFSVRVTDKFGDNGLTGCAIIEKKSSHWRIDTFLLSCRIIGRQVEESMLTYIINEAAGEGITTLTGHYIPTSRNMPAKDFYKKNGFKLTGENEKGTYWTFPVKKNIEFPTIFTVILP